MSTVWVRILSGVIGGILVLGVILSKDWVFSLFVAAACCGALGELHLALKQHKKWQLVVINYLFAICFLLFPFLKQNMVESPLMFLIFSHLVLLLISSVIWHETIKFNDVLCSFFMVIYAVFLPLHLIYIRLMDHGLVLCFLVFLGSWMPDTFAYFSGMLFGKHKLIPAVSPKKTVEGAIGACLGGVISFVVYGLILQHFGGYQVAYVPLVILSLICGVIAQFGDLSASVIKRNYGIKDFGNLIPGHGGIVDRIDSLVFVTPVVYYFISLFEVFYK